MVAYWYLVASATGSKTMSVTINGTTTSIMLGASSFIRVAGRQPHAHGAAADGVRRHRDHPRASSASMMRTSAAVSMSDPTRTMRPPSSTIPIVPGLGSVLAGVDGDDA